jgi:hypothetical protein
MEIKRVSSQPSGRAGRVVHSDRADRSAFSGTRSGTGSGRQRNVLSPARGLHGTRIRSPRLSSSQLGVAGAQRWGGPIEGIRPGDVVWFAPGERHWRGAAPTTAMTHIAIEEKLDGKVVDWMEQVAGEQYRAGK